MRINKGGFLSVTKILQKIRPPSTVITKKDPPPLIQNENQQGGLSYILVGIVLIPKSVELLHRLVLTK